MQYQEAILKGLLSPEFPWTQIVCRSGSQMVTVADAIDYFSYEDPREVERTLDEIVSNNEGERRRPFYMPLSPVEFIAMLRARRRGENAMGEVYEMPASFFEKHGVHPDRRRTLKSMG